MVAEEGDHHLRGRRANKRRRTRTKTSEEGYEETTSSRRLLREGERGVRPEEDCEREEWEGGRLRVSSCNALR